MSFPPGMAHLPHQSHQLRRQGRWPYPYQNTHRATRTEIKILPAVDVPALQKLADDASRDLRLLDNTLQATNWTSDLLE